MAARRLLSLTVLVLATSVALVGPVAADPYGPSTGSATVSKTVVKQGQYVRVSGDDFCPNSLVRFTVRAGGDRYIDKTVFSDADGDVSDRLQLTGLGDNKIRLSGCYSNGGRQVLTATVRVIPHQGKAKVDDDKVNKGDRVTVSGGGFCARTDVTVTVSDDGTRYQQKTVEAGRGGQAERTVRLTRAGDTRITLDGCSARGFTQSLTASVKVRSAKTFRGSPAAYAQDVATQVPVTAYAVAGAGLLALFVGVQVAVTRRRRAGSSS